MPAQRHCHMHLSSAPPLFSRAGEALVWVWSPSTKDPQVPTSSEPCWAGEYGRRSSAIPQLCPQLKHLQVTWRQDQPFPGSEGLLRIAKAENFSQLLPVPRQHCFTDSCWNNGSKHMCADKIKSEFSPSLSTLPRSLYSGIRLGY